MEWFFWGCVVLVVGFIPSLRRIALVLSGICLLIGLLVAAYYTLDLFREIFVYRRNQLELPLNSVQLVAHRIDNNVHPATLHGVITNSSNEATIEEVQARLSLVKCLVANKAQCSPISSEKITIKNRVLPQQRESFSEQVGYVPKDIAYQVIFDLKITDVKARRVSSEEKDLIAISTKQSMHFKIQQEVEFLEEVLKLPAEKKDLYSKLLTVSGLDYEYYENKSEPIRSWSFSYKSNFLGIPDRVWEFGSRVFITFRGDGNAKAEELLVLDEWRNKPVVRHYQSVHLEQVESANKFMEHIPIWRPGEASCCPSQYEAIEWTIGDKGEPTKNELGVFDSNKKQ